MKTARRIIIPDDRKISYNDYIKIQSHIHNSIMWYIYNYGKNYQQLCDKMQEKGLSKGTLLCVLKNNGTEEYHDIVTEELDRLVSLKIVNDDLLCQQKVYSLLRKNKSIRTIKNILLQNKFSQASINLALENINISHEHNAIKKEIEKKKKSSAYKKRKTFYERKNYIIKHLLSQGFSYDSITTVIKDIDFDYSE